MADGLESERSIGSRMAGEPEEIVAEETDIESLLACAGSRDPLELIEPICRLADAMGEDACNALLASRPGLLKYASVLTEANYRRILSYEFGETERMLQLRPPESGPVGELLSERERVNTYGRVGDMFHNVDFSQCRRMVIVGGGPNPVTAFHVYDRTGVPDIVVIDVRPEAIDKVSALIAHFGLSRMRAEIRNGLDFDYRGTEVVFVANMVASKAAVISRIVDTAPAAVQIVAREPYGLGVLWAESAERELDARLMVAGKGRHGSPLSRDVYLRRRSSPSKP